MKLKDILLVDDDRDDQNSFVCALREVGTVELFDVVNNGKEALHRLQRALILPSLIVMDVNMPVMNGIECLEKIKTDPLMKSIPVIIMTTSVIQEEKARQLGATGFIKKPVSDDQLTEYVRQIVNYDPSFGEFNLRC